MTTPNDGGPAFPAVETTWNRDCERLEVGSYGGMSLRDWFAGQALAGMLGDPSRSGELEDYAKEAWLAADAMIAARKGTP